MLSTNSSVSRSGFVSSNRKKHVPPNSCATPKSTTDGFRVADVQVAVRLGREARLHAPAVLTGRDLVRDDLTDEVAAALGVGVFVGFHGRALSFNRAGETQFIGRSRGYVIHCCSKATPAVSTMLDASGGMPFESRLFMRATSTELAALPGRDDARRRAEPEVAGLR